MPSRGKSSDLKRVSLRIFALGDFGVARLCIRPAPTSGPLLSLCSPFKNHVYKRGCLQGCLGRVSIHASQGQGGHRELTL